MLTVVSVGASADVFVANLMTLSLAKLYSIWCRMASEKESGLNKVVQDRDKWWEVVNIIMSLQAPKSSQNFLTNKGTVSFSRPPLIDLAQGSHSAPISGTISASTLGS